MDEKSKQYLPFNIYDFFGYLFPGVIFCILGILFLKFGLTDETAYARIYMIFKNYISFDFNLAASTFIVSIGLIVLYVIGFIIGALGSIVIDRMIIRNTIGYPFSKMLEENKNSYKYSHVFSYVVLILLNLLLILSFLDLWLFLMKEIFLISIFILLVLTANKVYREKIIKWSNSIIYSLSKLIGTDSKIEQQLITQYKKVFEEKFKFENINLSSENYWLAYFSILDKKPLFDSLFRNWLYLYSFSRNIAFVFYFYSTLCSILILFYPIILNIGNIHLFLLIVMLIGLISFLRYWVIYKSYYTKNLIRAFLVINT